MAYWLLQTPTPQGDDWWFQQQPSAEVTWIGFAIGLVAFVLAVLAMAQMLWRRAQLHTEYSTVADGEDRSLVIHLKNPPVSRKVLKRIGVRRLAVQSLESYFSIREAGSGAVLDAIRHARFRAGDDPSDADDYYQNRIVLPPTYSVGASMMIAIWDKDNAKAVIVPDRLRSAMALSAGLYNVEIIYMIDGEGVRESHAFKVGERGDDLMWVGGTSERVNLDR